MKLIILGSGTSIPLADRASPSLALIVAGSPILFDMGPGTLCQMTRAGLDFEKIEQIFNDIEMQDTEDKEKLKLSKKELEVRKILLEDNQVQSAISILKGIYVFKKFSEVDEPVITEPLETVVELEG